MTTYQIHAIPPAELAAIRAAGRDVAGNPFEPFVAAGQPVGAAPGQRSSAAQPVGAAPGQRSSAGCGGAPLRCCLRPARPGERIALVAYRPAGTAGGYAETGPVFVHAAACDGYPADGGWPPEFLDRPQVLRAYDARGRIADALAVEPGEHETGIAKLLADPANVVLHSRNVLYGCYMFAVSR